MFRVIVDIFQFKVNLKMHNTAENLDQSDGEKLVRVFVLTALATLLSGSC